jgi:hypothetical protein
VARSFIAYARAFIVDAPESTVIHHADAARFTDWQGEPHPRHVRIAGDHLFTTGSPRVDAANERFRSELHWT